MPKVPVSYTNKDFQSIKADLVEYVKTYYPDTYKDFNKASFGSLLFDLVAIVGDQLSFFVDYNFNESNIDTAIEKKNIYQLAKQKGYKFKKNSTASGKCMFYVIVPSASAGNGPDQELIPILKSGTLVQSKSGVIYMLVEDVNFSSPDAVITVAAVNSNGVPTSWAIRTEGTIISGEPATETHVVEAYEKFLRIELSDANIQQILSVYDSEGNEYYEVDFLSQDVIFQAIPTTENPGSANYILKKTKVARRFVVEQDENGKTFLQFGYGNKDSLDDNDVPEASEVALELVGKNYFSDSSFDPSNLLKTDKFGIVPENTTLTVSFRRNTSDNNNAPASSVSSVVLPLIDFSLSSTYTKSQKSSLISEFECDNEDPITGDVEEDPIDDIRIKAKDYFSTQFRAVTKQDYISIAQNMPSAFGAIKRANAVQDKDSLKRNINLYVISEDSNQKLAKASDLAKKNLKTWLSQYKMINDTIDILDATIINIGIKFVVSAKQGSSKSDVLVSCLNSVKSLFATKKNIGEPLYIGEIFKILNLIPDVVDASSVSIVKKYGANYSNFAFNVDKSLSSDKKVLYVPENCILEVKFPDQDIVGSVQ